MLGRFVVTCCFPAGIRENLEEFLVSGAKGAISSCLLVAWQSRAANFRSNLGDAFLAIFGLPPGSKLRGAAPEIQLVPPSARRPDNAALALQPTLNGAPELKVQGPDMHHGPSGPKRRLVGNTEWMK